MGCAPSVNAGPGQDLSAQIEGDKSSRHASAINTAASLVACYVVRLEYFCTEIMLSCNYILKKH